MAIFSYNGFDKNGVPASGTLEAATEKLAFEILDGRGIVVFELSNSTSVSQPKLPWYRRDVSFGSSRISFEHQAIVAELLSTLFSAGLSGRDAVRIAAISAEKPEVRVQFERTGQRMDDGVPLAEAFEAENRRFSPIFASFLAVSDAASDPISQLSELALFFRRQGHMRQKIMSALIYPAILVLAAICLLLVVILYLAPNLAPLFASVGKAPPGTLGTLISMNELLRAYWPGMLCGVFVLVSAGFALLQQPPVLRGMSRTLFHLPMLGALLQLSILARLTHATRLLIEAGLPLPEALRKAGQMIGGQAQYANLFENAAIALEEGRHAATVFDTSQLVPPTFRELFRIGEQTNRLTLTLNALSVAMNAQVEQSAQRFLTLLTPVLTLVLGSGIGLLVYTLMGAILEVNELAF